MSDHHCRLCGAVFQRTMPRSNTLYCSDACRKQVKVERDRIARKKYREEMGLAKLEEPVKKLLPCLVCDRVWLTTDDTRICPECKSSNTRRHRLSCYRFLGPWEAI